MDLRYPIGQFQFAGELTPSLIEEWIRDIEVLPSLLRETVKDLSVEQLDTPYRASGWTVRQVVHHVIDSHLNAYLRFKLALTEENPVIKPYEEGKWAELSDYQLPVEHSLVLLEALHIRLVNLLRSLTPAEWERTFIHPDSGTVSVGKNIGMYAWHGQHHLAHIRTLCERNNW
ncbi:YfiT family bacillithiol transferase [Neobacillus jeddahensis]|uniref:YfiT family bacillithiol transferase n=1 Tax=Neobacillus jeddahensis TaxID=1461580 RepID=UPI00058E3CCB|nr:putative metal-dependent hydrolase [Neobacillus jeddahensis]